MKIKKLARKAIREMSEIKWGSTEFSNDTIILKWGENPYSPADNILDDMKDSLSNVNRYPNLRNKLISVLANYNNVKTNQISLTNGSDKAFRLIAEIFISKADEAITFYPSYPVFDGSILMMEGKLVKLALDKEFKIPDIEIIKKNISSKTKLIYLCNPNNPTGNFIATNKQIEQILKLGKIVIVDEAYFEFSKKTCVELLKNYPNLIILRSFSKTFGLAGLRVGYCLTSKEIIKLLDKIEISLEVFNTSTPSLAGAISSIKNFSLVEQNIQKINDTRNILLNELKKQDIYVYPSFTSFILFNLKAINIKTKKFIDKMKEQKVILKDVSIYKGLSEYDVYMAIPKEEQLEKILSAIKNSI